MKLQTPEVSTTDVVMQPAPQGWPTYSHDIDATEARELIGRYKRANPGSRAAVAINRAAVDNILAQPGCLGMRMYFGLNPDGTQTLVLVGVDEFGNDLDKGPIADKVLPCPPYCSMDSLLDS